MKIVPVGEGSLSPFEILVHLGLMVFGIAALITGELADNHKQFKQIQYLRCRFLSGLS